MGQNSPRLIYILNQTLFDISAIMVTLCSYEGQCEFHRF